MAPAKASAGKSATRRKTGKAATPPTEDLLEYLKDMLLIRRFEEKAGQMYGMGLIGGFCHLYIGQEAVVVGMQAAIGEGDSVITSYRDHGHMLVCGMDPKGVMAELTGRRGPRRLGTAPGRGHCSSRKQRGAAGIAAPKIRRRKLRAKRRICKTTRA